MMTIFGWQGKTVQNYPTPQMIAEADLRWKAALKALTPSKKVV